MLSLPLLLFATTLTSLLADVFSFMTPASLSINIAVGLRAASQSPLSSDAILELSAASSSSDETSSPCSATCAESRRRRKFLKSTLTAQLLISSSLATLPRPASAASEKPPPIIPLLTTARRLHAVPTFTIVDGDGVPFHTYEKDSAGGFGYFFTSYTSAEYVLDDAKKAFAKAKTEAVSNKESGAEGAIGEEGSTDVPDAWGKAQIVTLPLDVVMQLSVKKTQSVAQNAKGKSFSTYYQVIPSSEDKSAALRIENSQRYSERARVPLFYVDGLTIPSAEEGSRGVANPVYFRIKDLRAEWQRQHAGSELPAVKVRELNETFRAMIRPGGNDESVRNLVFVPIPDSVEKAMALGRSYKLGEMILTK